jgi:hypothetical protein
VSATVTPKIVIAASTAACGNQRRDRGHRCMAMLATVPAIQPGRSVAHSADRGRINQLHDR